MGEPRQKMKVICVGGMCSVQEQWSRLSSFITREGYTVTAHELPGHGVRTFEGISDKHVRDYVRDVCLLIKDEPDKVVLIGHSLGALIALKAAERYPEKVLSVITIAHAAFRQAQTGMTVRKQFLAPRYLSAIVGKVMSLGEKQEKFLTGNNGHKRIPIGHESGHVFRELALGVSIPKFSELYRKGVPCVQIVPIDDQAVPLKTAMLIAAWHKTNPVCIPGGHYAHYDEETCSGTAEVILNILKHL